MSADRGDAPCSRSDSKGCVFEKCARILTITTDSALGTLAYIVTLSGDVRMRTGRNCGQLGYKRTGSNPRGVTENTILTNISIVSQQIPALREPDHITEDANAESGKNCEFFYAKQPGSEQYQRQPGIVSELRLVRIQCPVLGSFSEILVAH